MPHQAPAASAFSATQRLTLQRVELAVEPRPDGRPASGLAHELECLDGVREATVNPVTGRAVVLFDPGRVSVEQLVRAVECHGYEAGRSVARWRLPLNGLDGTNGARRLERAVARIPGVRAADIDLLGATLTVAYSPRRTDITMIRETMVREGFEPGPQPSLSDDDDLPYPTAQHEAEYGDLSRRLWFTAAVAVPVVLITHPTLIGWHPDAPDLTVAGRAVWLAVALLSLPALLYGGFHFYRSLWLSFKHRSADGNMLVALAATVAWVYSAGWAAFSPTVEPAPTGGPLFDVAIGLVGLVLLGQTIEVRARIRAARPLARARALLPAHARVRRNGTECELPRQEVVVGDVVVVNPGESAPVDGTVIENVAVVDGSGVTGAAPLLECPPGAGVLAGSRNSGGSFALRATHVGKDTRLRRILDLATEAQGTKAPEQRRLESFAGNLTPAVVIMAVLAFMGWYTFGPAPALRDAVLVSLAVLLAASPRAVALAAPTAVAVGVARALRDGILVRSADAFRAVRRADTVVIGDLNHSPHDVDVAEMLAWSVRRLGFETIAGAWLTAGDERTISQSELSRAIQRLQRRGRRVAVVTDGHTEQAALSQADVGIALGAGADVAAEAGDLTVLDGCASRVSPALALGRRTANAIRQNIVLAWGYNGLALPAALGAWYALTGTLLSPWAAAAIMVAGTLTVVANADRLWRTGWSDRP